jgi:hypothetical protein
MDFGKKGTALNMLNSLFECTRQVHQLMSRPVDAIKHQAKTVTVGTSRISERVEGMLFDALPTTVLDIAQLSTATSWSSKISRGWWAPSTVRFCTASATWICSANRPTRPPSKFYASRNPARSDPLPG